MNGSRSVDLTVCTRAAGWLGRLFHCSKYGYAAAQRLLRWPCGALPMTLLIAQPLEMGFSFSSTKRTTP